MFSLFKKKFIDETLNEQLEDLNKFIAKTGTAIEIQEDCDSLPKAFGDFGYTHTNPIPVNGALGELKYLHRLRCKCNTPLYFHRIGTKKVDWINGPLDIYEIVCYEGLHWDILFFHLYHPRRSKQIPKDFSFCDFHPLFSKIPIVIGTNFYVERFPFNLSPNVKKMFPPDFEIFLDKILSDYEKSMQNNPKRFERPQTQVIKLEEAMTN